MTEAVTSGARRFAGWLPEVVLVASALAIVANWVLLIDAGFQGDPIMTGADIVAWFAGLVVRWKRPDLPASLWFALLSFPDVSLTEAMLDRLISAGADATSIALANLALIAAGAWGGVGLFYVVALYPVCRPETTAERRFVPVVWLLTLPPVITAFATAKIPFEFYADTVERDNPLHILPFTLPPELAASSTTALIGLLVGFWLLVGRYRRGAASTCRQIRVLLFPLSLLAIGILMAVVFQERAQAMTWVVIVAALYSFSPSLAVGILQPAGLDVDAVVRRVLVYGALWLALAVVYVAAGTLVGIAAGTYLPVEWSVAVAIVAAMLFQPARATARRARQPVGVRRTHRPGQGDRAARRGTGDDVRRRRLAVPDGVGVGAGSGTHMGTSQARELRP